MSQPTPLQYAHAFFADAKVYLEAAEKLWDSQESSLHFHMPIGALLNHAVELALKAYCMFCDETPENLRYNFGHNLEKLYNFACNLGLSDWLVKNPDDLRQLQKWNEANIRQTGRFPRRYAEFGVHPANDEFLREFARRLIEACARKSFSSPDDCVDLGIPEFDPDT